MDIQEEFLNAWLRWMLNRPVQTWGTVHSDIVECSFMEPFIIIICLN